MAVIAALVALRQPDQLRSHLERGLANGVTATKISEIITQLAIYAGFPAANVAAQVALPLFEERALLAKIGRAA